jgi:predicted transcriptional regulator
VKLENLEATRMRRSKLETNIEILNTLARLGPLKMTHIMHKANVNGSILRGHLDFLIK